MQNAWYMTELLAADHRDSLESAAQGYRLFKSMRPVRPNVRRWPWRLRRQPSLGSAPTTGRLDRRLV